MPETQRRSLRYSRPARATGENQGIELERELARVDFRISSEAHIVLDSRVCAGCETRPCLIACPARLFVETSAGEVVFNYENCFECGTCYMVCDSDGALSWDYPRGGYGVRFHRS